MTARPEVSLCLIARDSARTLGPCLESIRPWVDEMVVVDTGSRDATPELARGIGARVFEFPWCDDFAAARNASLGHARGRWLFWMDSDDTIDEANGRRLRDLVHAQHPSQILGFVMQVHCPGASTEGEKDYIAVDHVKLIRNLPGLRFDGRIHEQVLPAIRQLGGDVGWTDIHVVHSGSDQSPEGRNRKLERDLRILCLELAERPDHPFTLFNLGMTHADAGDHPRAIEFLYKSIANSGEGETHLRKAYALLVSSYLQLQQYDEASRVCNLGRNLFPNDPELLFRSAMLAHKGGRFEEAQQGYLQLLDHKSERCFSSVDSGITGFKARHNLAAVYQDSGRVDLAEVQWRTIIRELPNYRLGRQGLLETLFKLRRWQTAAIEVEQLIASNTLHSMGLVARARLAELQGDFASAERDFLTATESYPGELEPLESLCRFRFEHGDPEQALHSLLQLSALRPNDGGILHNLGAINSRLGNYQAAVDGYEASLRVRPDSATTRRELASVLLAIKKGSESSAIAVETESATMKISDHF